MDPLPKFQSLLRQLFQFDCADLDFGIYRIMNHKRDVLEKWISETLPARVEAELRTGALRADSTTADRMEELKTQLVANFGGDALDGDGNLAPTFHGTPLGRQYRELQEAARHAIAGGDQRAIIFNHLYQFFSHYYDSGDFMSLRRYSSRQKYAIPYNGEEVHLHWANADQYYIKTSEYFTDYRWKAPAPMGKGEFSVLFKLRNAEQEPGNNKANAKRYFCYSTDELEFDEASRTLVLPVTYRALTAKEEKDFAGNGDKPQQMLNDRALAGVLAHAVLRTQPDLKAAITAAARNASGQEMIDPQTKEPIPMLLKHLRTYSRRNNSDFFIHKDLDGFLTRELDFYLKNEVLSLDTLLAGGPRPAEGWFQLLHVIKTLGKDIITFLAQLENFQKTLFEKRKFITDCHWCLTLDRVAADLLPEIAANPAQWAQWEDLHTLSTIEPKSKSWAKGKDPDKALAWLKSMPFLMVDTSLFKDSDFQDRLLATIPNIDDQMDGLLVHSENFQGLNFLRHRYSGSIQSIYIDPPYNTDASPIAYKNGFKCSTWMSMLAQALDHCPSLLSPTGVLAAAIDDVQQRELAHLIDDHLPGGLIGTICVRSNPSGRPTKSGYAISHEYVLFGGATLNSTIARLPPTDEQASRFSESDRQGPFEWRNLRREGSNSDRSARPALFYPIYISGTKLRVPAMTWDATREEWSIDEKPKKGEQVVYPVNDDGQEKTWRWEGRTVTDSMELLAVRPDRTGRPYPYYKRRPNEDGVVTVSSWFDAKYSATEHGTAVIKGLFASDKFSYPKSLFAVSDSLWISGCSKADSVCLDFFGGSGTTGHAIVNLNRQHKGGRKYIMVEMGNHFSTVLKPRMQKVAFAKTWKSGKPAAQSKPTSATNPFEGISHAFKVIRLESYEDTLANIEFTHEAEGELFTRQIGEEYLLKYALDFETQGSATRLRPEALVSPFDYRLNLFDGTEIRSKPVDLPETFHYLIGLKVESRRWIERKMGKAKTQRYLHVTGTANGDGKRVVVVWRTVPEDWKEADYQAEKEWARETGLFDGADRGWYNGPGTFLGAHPLDAEFRRLLFA